MFISASGQGGPRPASHIHPRSFDCISWCQLIVSTLKYKFWLYCNLFAAFISGLCKESKDEAVVRLLQCLPLLQPGNEQAKFEYLRIIPKIMSHSLENGCHLEESRHLLSYLLIHPAIKREEFADFTFWLNGLEESRKENSSHMQHAPVHRSSSNLSNYCTNDTSRNQLMIQLANGYDVSYLKDLGANMSTGMKNDGTISSCSRDSGIFETDRNFRTLTSSNSVPLTGSSSYPMQPWNDSPLPPARNFPDSSLLSPGQLLALGFFHQWPNFHKFQMIF